MATEKMNYTAKDALQLLKDLNLTQQVRPTSSKANADIYRPTLHACRTTWLDFLVLPCHSLSLHFHRSTLSPGNLLRHGRPLPGTS